MQASCRETCYESVNARQASRLPIKTASILPTPVCYDPVAQPQVLGTCADRNKSQFNTLLYDDVQNYRLDKECCSANSLTLHKTTAALSNLPTGYANGSTQISDSRHSVNNECPHIPNLVSHADRSEAYFIYSDPHLPFLDLAFVQNGCLNASAQLPAARSHCATNFSERCSDYIVDHDLCHRINFRCLHSSHSCFQKAFQRSLFQGCLTYDDTIIMSSERSSLDVGKSTPLNQNIKLGKRRCLPGVSIHPLRTGPPSRQSEPSSCMESPLSVSSPTSTLRTFGVNSPASTASVLTPSVSHNGYCNTEAPYQTGEREATHTLPIPAANSVLIGNTSAGEKVCGGNVLIKDKVNRWVQEQMDLLNKQEDFTQFNSWFETVSDGSDGQASDFTCAENSLSSGSANRASSSTQDTSIEDPNTFWTNYYNEIEESMLSNPADPSELLDRTAYLPGTPFSTGSPYNVYTNRSFNVRLRNFSVSQPQSSYQQVWTQSSSALCPNYLFSNSYRCPPVANYHNNANASVASSSAVTLDHPNTVYATVDIQQPRPKRPIDLLRNAEFVYQSSGDSDAASPAKKRRKFESDQGSLATSDEAAPSSGAAEPSNNFVVTADFAFSLMPFFRFDSNTVAADEEYANRLLGLDSSYSSVGMLESRHSQSISASESNLTMGSGNQLTQSEMTNTEQNNGESRQEDEEEDEEPTGT